MEVGNFKWAIELKSINDFEIEKTLFLILSHLNSSMNQYKCLLSNVDATGLIGNELAEKTSGNIVVEISLNQIIEVLKEDGQIFDMNLELYSEYGNYRIMVLRGEIINVLGDSQKLPGEALGEYQELDIKMFNLNS